MDLDAENADALGYARADIDAPAKHADSEARVFTPRQSAPTPRRNMVPVHACVGATEILQRLAASTPLGDVVDESNEHNRRDAAALSQGSFQVGDVPWEIRVRPVTATRRAAAFLAEALAAVADGKLVASELGARVDDAFEAFMGFHPSQAWIPAFLAELRGAALERLNWANYIADLDASKQAAFREPPALLAHADLVIQRTRAAVASSLLPCDLPEWLDAQLVASFIPRFGFGRGKGGTSRVVSEKTMAGLLASPRLMLKDLLRSPNGEVRWNAHIRKLRRDPRF